MSATAYDQSFFQGQQSGSEQSANLIVPMLLERFSVRSVIDVGCGVGPWLRAFSNLGVTDLTGLDGGYVKHTDLLFPAELFHATDLTTDFPIARRYDLACSLEVAEHLPYETGPNLIAKLCKAAPVVVFSAAIPGQGGTEHINEAWQDSWREQFARHGFLALDFVRPNVWGRRQVEWWYQQNLITYVDPTVLVSRPELRAVDDSISLNVVHPDCYSRQVDAASIYLSKALKQLPRLFSDAARRRFHQLTGARAG